MKEDGFYPETRPGRHTEHIPRRLSLAIRRAGDNLRLGLILDLGPKEEDLTAAQKALIEKICGLYQITRALEDWIGKEGIIRRNRLNPVLAVYVSHINSLRLCLRELGIKRPVGQEAPKRWLMWWPG